MQMTFNLTTESDLKQGCFVIVENNVRHLTTHKIQNINILTDLYYIIFVNFKREM